MRIGKKFLTVLIILFLCLSPLNAIDLHQWDSDNSHLNDLNGTDIEIESINEPDEIINEPDESIKGNDVEIQNLSINDTNSSKNLKLKKLDIKMQVDDTTYGQSAVVKIWFNNDGFGYTYNPRIIVEDKYSSEVYTKDYFTRGCNEIKLRNNLEPGNYTVTYAYNGKDYWESKTVTDNFTVNKINPNLNASIEDVYVGEKPVLKVSSNEKIWGDGMAYSPQFTKDYNFHYSNGEAGCTIDEDLPAGNYTCTVNYFGDFLHAKEDVTVNFAVKKHDPNLTVQVDNVTVNDLVPIKIRANESANGEVTYLIKPRSKTGQMPITRTVKIVDGVFNDTLDLHLQPGQYSVSAYFKGDDCFKESTVFSTFYVNKTA